jgi:signal transduction histidine kinase
MTPEILDRIRRPHFTTKEGGTGLGVAVARGLIEQHGGRIDYRSAAGKGTTVTLSLPMKAKPCARLPNPLRAIKHDGAEVEKPEPAVAAAR